MSAVSVSSLSKRFGRVTAVDEVSFEARPGVVTAFLGPNGAGKTTTLRALLGLIRPSGGTALIGGQAYAELADPVRRVGAVLERSGFHPGRSGRDHLRVLARAAGIPESRASETIELAGLAGAERRRVGGYSLGMRQRLAIAAALLGEPEVLILDEPANGLDPQGIRWLRELLRYQAWRGCAVLVSSHVLAEVSQTADDVIVIDRGRVVAQGPISELSARAGGTVEVRSPDASRFAEALRARKIQCEAEGSDALLVRGSSAAEVGKLALANAVILHHLAERGASLEELFLELTGEEGQ